MLLIHEISNFLIDIYLIMNLKDFYIELNRSTCFKLDGNIYINDFFLHIAFLLQIVQINAAVGCCGLAYILILIIDKI